MTDPIGGAAEEAARNEQWLDWLIESYAVGIGVPGFSLFVLFGGALAMMNWTETLKAPAVWLTVMSPLVASTLPVAVVWRILGLVTTALALLFLGLYRYWGRVG
ncbi:hypothetical protein ACOJIV_25010 [Haloarcula sp. AONF1]